MVDHNWPQKINDQRHLSASNLCTAGHLLRIDMFLIPISKDFVQLWGQNLGLSETICDIPQNFPHKSSWASSQFKLLVESSSHWLTRRWWLHWRVQWIPFGNQTCKMEVLVGKSSINWWCSIVKFDYRRVAKISLGCFEEAVAEIVRNLQHVPDLFDWFCWLTAVSMSG